MIVAGEASGDAHAAKLVRAIREIAAHAEFFGATGLEMRQAGVESIVETDQLSITGLVEIASVLPKFWRAYQLLRDAALTRRPAAVILVDWPDFNLRLARNLHRHNLKIIYYISPQLWAWRSYRARNVRRDVDLLLSVLPFEPAWYAARGIDQVEFIGHPLVGEVAAQTDRANFLKRHTLDPLRPLVALLPGSRRTELARILPVMLEAAEAVSQALPTAQFVIPLAPNRSSQEVASLLLTTAAASASTDNKLHDSLRIVQGETIEALAAADAAAVASGTATLEAALLATPLVIVYKESKFNWHTLGRLINTDHYGLINLIEGERIATELMQNDFTSGRLAEELIRLLEPERNAAMRQRLRAATLKLGPSGASNRAATAVLRCVKLK